MSKDYRRKAKTTRVMSWVSFTLAGLFTLAGIWMITVGAYATAISTFSCVVIITVSAYSMRDSARRFDDLAARQSRGSLDAWRTR